MDFQVGQRVSATKRDHGHLARPRTKTFTGIIEHIHEGTTGSGNPYWGVCVRLEPNMKNVRWFYSSNSVVTIIEEK